MVWGVLAVVLLVVVAVLAKKAGPTGRETRDGIDPKAYYAVKPLTTTEQSFYRILAKSLPEYIILAQIDLKRIVRAKRGKNYAHFNRIAQLSLDYVVCREDFSVVAAVELDDPSHRREIQRSRDNKKDAVMRAIGIPLIRYDVEKLPTETSVRGRFAGIA